MGILVCGNPTIDEIVRGNRVHVLPGGAALYASTAAACLGSRVTVVGNVGKDYPDKYVRWLRQHGVGVSLLRRVQGSTTRFRIHYDNGERKLWLLSRGRKISGVPILSRSAVHLGPVFHEISTQEAVRIRSSSSFLSLDLQGMIRTTDSTGLVTTMHRPLDNLLRICDVVKCSAEELNWRGSRGNRIGIVRRLLLSGPDFALMTLGTHGSILAIRDGLEFSIPAYHDPGALDPTGAGDVLIGSWLSVYLRTRDPVWSAAVGSAFASLTSRKMGLSKFAFSRRELLKRSAWVYTRIRTLHGL